MTRILAAALALSLLAVGAANAEPYHHWRHHGWNHHHRGWGHRHDHRG
jgi:hypothetical protein